MLKAIDLVARPGEVTAVIGSTGSGKSTLLGLVPRLFDVTDGEVLVDGVAVAEIDPVLLAKTVGLVPQKPYLFAGTVATNLRYGNPDATDEELWHALAVAQAKDFVSGLENGLDSPIAQGGTNVSGGQRQRLAIARTPCSGRRSTSSTTPSPPSTTRPTRPFARRSPRRPRRRPS